MAPLRYSLVAAALALTMVMGAAASPEPAHQADEVERLNRLVQEQAALIADLKARVERLEKGQMAGPASDEPDIPPIELPGGGPEADQAPVAATRTPDISVIGNNIGRFLGVRGEPDRNRLQLGELELGFQQPLYPGIRFDAFLAAGAHAGFTLGVEEAYATASRLGSLPAGALVGRKRLSFGKANPIHPHSRPYVDQPAPLGAFLGEEALTGNGAALTWLLPVKDVFANLEVGFWGASAHAHSHGEVEAAAHEEDEHEHEHEPGAGVIGDFPLARLWLSRELGPGSELEIGGSYGFGKSAHGARIALMGLDATLSRSFGTFGRLTLQGEYLRHSLKDVEGGTGRHTRSGHYALLAWKPDQYREVGLRYDSTRFPWPLEGREQTTSLILSNRLTETTAVRLQLKYGDRLNDHYLPARRGFTELYLQFLWGAGSHTHPLQ